MLELNYLSKLCTSFGLYLLDSCHSQNLPSLLFSFIEYFLMASVPCTFVIAVVVVGGPAEARVGGNYQVYLKSSCADMHSQICSFNIHKHLQGK